ncbi:quinolinate synthase NadA [Coriobacteriia bacterium Es71-Z0120]|uniref:quinolinate synthase NadA n=1 Tax=Parvivirga hydrogeniphila TaxID=2939460 RepID=UPI002260CD6F|nr:quinolinate synthase NadA [Parvivirga hydrogeniphila]MCL4079404.1 quinolinate synthase NadA [Parvivirga hydrogeniphila]
MTGQRDAGVLAEEVRRLAAERGAVILAHNYQRAEVQDVADFVGDSLGLSRQAAATDASVIVFAGVHFMAETAKILSPSKTVLMPEPAAGCPMADMITAEQAAAFKAQHPGVPLVTYVNSSAEVKAVSDVCCTSANAPEVVRSLGVPRVLFAPDRNLAAWVATQVSEVEVIAWDGYCPTHDHVSAEAVAEAAREHPDAEVLVHPECRPEVVALADAVLSTSGMLRHVAVSPAEEFVVVTEEGLMHGLAKAAPEKRFFGVCPPMLCPNMKLTTLMKVRDCLQAMSGRIEVAEDVRARAAAAVERMVAIG